MVTCSSIKAEDAIWFISNQAEEHDHHVWHKSARVLLYLKQKEDKPNTNTFWNSHSSSYTLFVKPPKTTKLVHLVCFSGRSLRIILRRLQPYNFSQVLTHRSRREGVSYVTEKEHTRVISVWTDEIIRKWNLSGLFAAVIHHNTIICDFKYWYYSALKNYTQETTVLVLYHTFLWLCYRGRPSVRWK